MRVAHVNMRRLDRRDGGRRQRLNIERGRDDSGRRNRRCYGEVLDRRFRARLADAKDVPARSWGTHLRDVVVGQSRRRKADLRDYAPYGGEESGQALHLAPRDDANAAADCAR